MSEGVLGLAPSAPNGTELFVEVLKKQGIIDRATFSIDYRNINDKFSMTFGGIDTERVPYIDNFTFTDLYDDDSWSVAVSSMKYGNMEFGGQAVKAILDTSDIEIRLPPEDYKRWGNQTTYGTPCYKYFTSYECPCNSVKDEQFDALFFTINDYEYKLEPETFLLFHYINQKPMCRFRVYPSEDPSNTTVTLGLPFLKNFNVYYDPGNKQIGLYGESMVYTGDKDTTDDNKSPVKVHGDKSGGASFVWEFRLMATLFAISFVLNLILICCCCVCRREKQEKDEKEEPLLDQKRDSV